jgi:hypothetical protein
MKAEFEVFLHVGTFAKRISVAGGLLLFGAQKGAEVKLNPAVLASWKRESNR